MAPGSSEVAPVSLDVESPGHEDDVARDSGIGDGGPSVHEGEGRGTERAESRHDLGAGSRREHALFGDDAAYRLASYASSATVLFNASDGGFDVLRLSEHHEELVELLSCMASAEPVNAPLAWQEHTSAAGVGLSSADEPKGLVIMELYEEGISFDFSMWNRRRTHPAYYATDCHLRLLEEWADRPDLDHSEPFSWARRD